MKVLRLAIPAVVVLFLGVTAVSAGQSKDKPTESMAFAPRSIQAPSQEASPSTPVGARSLSAEEMADLMMARKEFKEAVQAYKKLVDQNPKNAVIYNKLGIALHKEYDLTGALRSYERAVKLDPTYADAQNNIGVIWYDKKKFTRAIRAYQKAIKMRADLAVSYSNLGYAYFADKKYEDSIGAFQQALKLDPTVLDHGPGRNGSTVQDRSVEDRAKFYFLLAKSFAESGNFARSLVYLRKAKDEGYKTINEVQTDPAFSAMLKLPEMQEVLAPRPQDAAH
ncbi:MAG TPA: tetratricopeptide repeat protein [Candidatus Acidoferrum sp.]|nr:tetratricopeptide repeat protein [Candidatus Acidoferrum sp.]